MLNESKQIEASVNAKLSELNIQYSVVYIGEVTRDKWQSDSWRVTFKRNGKSFSIDYFTGLGLRKMKPRAIEPTSNKKSIHYHAWAQINIVPVKPDATGVLYSLFVDSQALDMSFDNWASDYGYDSDSIKAITIYQQCCKIAKEMQVVFTRKDIESFNELLQGY